jgi:hypothetical protein
MERHNYKSKDNRYAIETYGSELAGDILCCDVCNKAWEDPVHFTLEERLEMIKRANL